MANDKGKGKQLVKASYGTGDKRRAESGSTSSASTRHPSPAAPSSLLTGLDSTSSNSGGRSLSDMLNPTSAPQSGTGSVSRATPNIPPSSSASIGPVQPTGTGTSAENNPAASPRPTPPTAPQPHSTGSEGSTSSPGPGGASSTPTPGPKRRPPRRFPQLEPHTTASGGSPPSLARAMASWGPFVPAHPPPFGGGHQGGFVAEPNTVTPDNRPPPSQDTDAHRHQRRKTDEDGSSH